MERQQCRRGNSISSGFRVSLLQPRDKDSARLHPYRGRSKPLAGRDSVALVESPLGLQSLRHVLEESGADKDVYELAVRIGLLGPLSSGQCSVKEILVSKNNGRLYQNLATSLARLVKVEVATVHGVREDKVQPLLRHQHGVKWICQ